MICVSIADIDFEQCRKVLSDIEMAEIRLDLLHFSPAQVKEIFSKHPQLIATHRPDSTEMSEEERKELLISAVNAGAAYVDVEIETRTAFKEAVKQACCEKGCKLIVSYHNHEKTPSKNELETIIEKCFGNGADIAKVACQVNGEADAARILFAFTITIERIPKRKKSLPLAWGKRGKSFAWWHRCWVRLLHFAALSAGKETAPGQLDRQTLQGILDRITG